MEPHETKTTLSLNEARNCIIAMSKPMGQAVELIEINLKQINDVNDQCKVYDADIRSSFASDPNEMSFPSPSSVVKINLK